MQRHLLAKNGTILAADALFYLSRKRMDVSSLPFSVHLSSFMF
jgi:hypothetical protein